MPPASTVDAQLSKICRKRPIKETGMRGHILHHCVRGRATATGDAYRLRLPRIAVAHQSEATIWRQIRRLLGVLELSGKWHDNRGDRSGTFWPATCITLIGRIAGWNTLAETSQKFGPHACIRASRVLRAAAHTDWLPGFPRIFLSRLRRFRRASSRALFTLGRYSTAVSVAVTPPAFERWTSYRFFFGSIMSFFAAVVFLYDSCRREVMLALCLPWESGPQVSHSKSRAIWPSVVNLRLGWFAGHLILPEAVSDAKTRPLNFLPVPSTHG
ncbi:unnamed protein product [Schistocephalus solidus]|uniref:Transposase n=1 Tax=Schistocephalus solidus TaxID=70667 RepID=A0A183SRJ5_SCHSO|nr:unnamed protein product [Schistocephalus solidus]